MIDLVDFAFYRFHSTAYKYPIKIAKINYTIKMMVFLVGPFTPQTVIDFWRMVWQENSKRIVMLTRLREDNIVRLFAIDCSMLVFFIWIQISICHNIWCKSMVILFMTFLFRRNVNSIGLMTQEKSVHFT